MLTAGIVGLPNVGKSTLFNALLRGHKAAVAAYPFCTIEPNVGVIEVPDPRLERLAEIYATEQRHPSAVEFFDIAGLVRGASRGEGLGNQFLSHIRQVDILVEVVRCFEDPNVSHVDGAVDARRDVETIHTELVLADLGSIERRREKSAKKVKSGEKAALAEMELLDRLEGELNEGRPARSVELTGAEREAADELFLLTTKPVILAVNVGEDDLGWKSSCARDLRELAATEGAGAVEICAELESQLTDLEPDEAAEYLAALDVETSGTEELIRSTYRRLGLITFFTGNEKEVRARAIPAGSSAAQAAGHVHTDFEKGFIAAEVIPYATLDNAGGFAAAREQGLIQLEGRDYEVQDGDVVLFRFNV